MLGGKSAGQKRGKVMHREKSVPTGALFSRPQKNFKKIFPNPLKFLNNLPIYISESKKQDVICFRQAARLNCAIGRTLKILNGD